MFYQLLWKKNVFCRESPYNQDAVKNMKQLPIKHSLDAPITVKEVWKALKKAQNRKSPGKNEIRIKQYKLLDDANVVAVARVLEEYRTNPSYDSSDWHDIRLKLLEKKGNPKNPKN